MHHAVGMGAMFLDVGVAIARLPVERVAIVPVDALVEISGEATNDFTVACGVRRAQAGGGQAAELLRGRNQHDGVPGAGGLHCGHYSS